MKEIPMLFSTDMVRAILDGRKTQTRRMVKPGFSIDDKEFHKIEHYESETIGTQAYWLDGRGSALGAKCPYGKPGDLLYVRETWYGGYQLDDKDQIGDDAPYIYDYFADTRDARPGDMSDDRCYFLFGSDKKSWPKWRPSIHMPKEAARIWLRVKDVRVERLQDISEEDARAEGIYSFKDENGRIRYKDYTAIPSPEDGVPTFGMPIASFSTLIEFTYGPESWDANRWVWVVSFEVISTTGKPDNL